MRGWRARHNPFGDGQASLRIRPPHQRPGPRHDCGLRTEGRRPRARLYRPAHRRGPSRGPGPACWASTSRKASWRRSIRGRSISRKSIWTGWYRASSRADALRASMQIEPADVFVIAVPTPFAEDHAPNNRLCAEGRDDDRHGAEARRHQSSSNRPRRWGRPNRSATCWRRCAPTCACPGVRGQGEQADIAIAYCPERVLPGRILVEADRQRSRHRRHHAQVRAQGADLLSPLRARGVRHDHRARRGNDETDRERVPRRQHRLRPTNSASSPTRWASMCGRSSASPTVTRGSISCRPARVSAVIASRSIPGSWSMPTPRTRR